MGCAQSGYCPWLTAWSQVRNTWELCCSSDGAWRCNFLPSCRSGTPFFSLEIPGSLPGSFKVSPSVIITSFSSLRRWLAESSGCREISGTLSVQCRSSCSGLALVKLALCLGASASSSVANVESSCLSFLF